MYYFAFCCFVDVFKRIYDIIYYESAVTMLNSAAEETALYRVFPVLLTTMTNTTYLCVSKAFVIFSIRLLFDRHRTVNKLWMGGRHNMPPSLYSLCGRRSASRHRADRNVAVGSHGPRWIRSHTHRCSCLMCKRRGE